jgi:hypothetical protein
MESHLVDLAGFITTTTTIIATAAGGSTCGNTRNLHHRTPLLPLRSSSNHSHPSSFLRLASLGPLLSEAGQPKLQDARSNPHDTRCHRRHYF